MESKRFEETLRKRLKESPLPTHKLWLRLQVKWLAKQKRGQRRSLFRTVAVFLLLIGIGGTVFFPDRTTPVSVKNPGFQIKPEPKVTNHAQPKIFKIENQSNTQPSKPQPASQSQKPARQTQTAIPLPVWKEIQYAVNIRPISVSYGPLKQMQLQRETETLLQQAQQRLALQQNREALWLKYKTYELLDEAEAELRFEATLKRNVLEVLKSGTKFFANKSS